jgi:hypothetical protein
MSFVTPFPNRRWLIIPASVVPEINFSQVLDYDANSLRYSIDKTKTFVKYEVNIIEHDETFTYTNPETHEVQTTTIYAGTYGRPDIYKPEYPEYTHEEILNVLDTDEWRIILPDQV